MNRFTKATLLAGTVMVSGTAASAVDIEYWQYIYDTRVEAIDQLIAKFEEANPDINVKQVTFPYADYQTRVVAANMAGKGPDVLQMFYGWTDAFVKGGVLQPLPRDQFPAATIESEFFPIVQAMKRGDDYYGLPTAVRSLALFYNKTLFAEAGIDAPPATLDELVEDAAKLAKRDDGGNYTTVGITLDMAGQDHQWWREVSCVNSEASPIATIMQRSPMALRRGSLRRNGTRIWSSNPKLGLSASWMKGRPLSARGVRG